ncbi:alpha/beta hydrolase fold domain-containing protein [Streptomyces sp. NPDC005963]|uniref:alpha/beta hydrolase n=1 Tax=Streptomyces sp. NPDC005963 TaxID=3156721 RepID=UPI0033E7CC90
MIMGNARSVLPQVLRAWAAPLGLAVASVAYRLAPRAQYPEPIEDCYAGFDWVAAHAAEPVIVGGTSAGGGLAAALASAITPPDTLRRRGSPRR